MIRLTRTFLFSLLCLLPLRTEDAAAGNLKADCPSGTRYCAACGGCLVNTSPCETASCYKVFKTISLQKKEGTVYSLEEGAIVKCEGNMTLVPTTSGNETYWTCRSKQ